MPEMREIERQQRDTWDRFSAGWIKWDPQVVEMQAPVGQEMIRLLALADDGVHLDVASGTGEPGLSIAAQMPKGRVVLTDLSEAMLAGARSKAEKRALGNVEIRVCRVDDLPFEDATFDSVSCRFGFMFFPDIRGAVSELVRIMRPGGRISTAVGRNQMATRGRPFRWEQSAPRSRWHHPNQMLQGCFGALLQIRSRPSSARPDCTMSPNQTCEALLRWTVAVTTGRYSPRCQRPSLPSLPE
jgi:SAM-dependent methyltransferase